MSTRDQNLPSDEAKAAVKTAPRPQDEYRQPPFDWRVLLLRYLPEPMGAAHSVKRFAAR